MREHLGFLETLLPPDTGSPGEPCTDLANAGRVFNLAANNLIWVENHGWYKWDGYAWQRDDLEALRIASKLGRKISSCRQ